MARGEEYNKSGTRVWLYGLRGNGYVRISYFYALQFPGCCGLAVIHDAALDGNFFDVYTSKERVIAAALAALYAESARQGGYTYVMTSETNGATYQGDWERAGFVADKWESVKAFTNRRTENKIDVFMKRL